LEPVTYKAAKTRIGKVPVHVKVFQGLGGIPNTFKVFAFNAFLLLYYDRVLGMPAAWASVALFVALVVDAISDPLVGSWSDNFRSRLGRRHPFMFAAVIPLGISIFLLFSPPAGFSHPQLFVWLLIFTVGTRLSMTFFEVPWSALFAEYSEDYTERSVIASYRVLVGTVAAVVFVFLIYTLVFPSSDAYPEGQLNPGGYPKLALALALCISGAALATTLLTRPQIPYLLQPQTEGRFSFMASFREVKLALENPDFRALFFAVLVAFVLAGTNGALEIYMRTYFWGLASEQLRWFAVGLVGAIAVLPLVKPLQEKFDKKQLLLGAWSLLLVDGMTLVMLRFADILPDNGDPLLLVLLVANAVFRAALGGILLIMFISMIADLLDAQELATGRRQEGVFMSSVSFSVKATAGFGLLIAGLLLENVIGFPQGSIGAAADLDPGIVFRLGVTDGIIVPLGYLLPFLLLRRGYQVTREKHERIRESLRLVRENGRDPGRVS
jgi:Na+/melibiose symporter-like transporter